MIRKVSLTYDVTNRPDFWHHIRDKQRYPDHDKASCPFGTGLPRQAGRQHCYDMQVSSGFWHDARAQLRLGAIT